MKAIVEAAGEVLDVGRSGGLSRAVVDDGSPDGTGRLADELAAEHAVGAGAPPHREERHRPRLSRRLPPRARARRGLRDGDGLATSPTTQPTSRDCSRPCTATPTSRSARAMCRAAALRDWGLLRRFISEGGSTYARLVLGLQVRDLTGGFKCFRREVLEAIHFDSVRSQRLRLPGRAHLPRGAGRLQGGGGADRLSRPPARAEQDVLADRRRGDVAGAAAALQLARCPADGWGMDASAYAFAHGVRHTRTTLRSVAARAGRGARALAGRLGAGRRGRPARGGPGRSPISTTATSRSHPAAALRGRRPRRRAARLAQQLARARAARDGLRGGLHRRELAAAAGRAPHGALALGARARRASRDRFVRAAPRPSR